FSSRRRHTRSTRDWSSDVCSSDLGEGARSGRCVHAHADANGRYRFQLHAGTYTVVAVTSKPLPRCSPTNATVSVNHTLRPGPYKIGRASCRERVYVPV